MNYFLLDAKSLIRIMKDALGDAMDDVTMDALEVADYMQKAGASKEEMAEMLSIIMSKDGGISQDFISKLKEAISSQSK